MIDGFVLHRLTSCFARKRIASWGSIGQTVDAVVLSPRIRLMNKRAALERESRTAASDFGRKGKHVRYI